jgi:hypothetical protein
MQLSNFQYHNRMVVNGPTMTQINLNVAVSTLVTTGGPKPFSHLLPLGAVPMGLGDGQRYVRLSTPGNLYWWRAIL